MAVRGVWLVLAVVVASTVAGAAGSVQVAPPDPETDVIGWEAGVWHDESIDVDQSDGLSDAEIEAFVARSMARVEVIREREFKEPVEVSVVTRDAYRDRQANREHDTEFDEWNDQVWESLFLIGESTGSNESLGSVTGETVAGFYSSHSDEIVIVTNGDPVIDNTTLIHELVHALQDQYVDLRADRFRGVTQDEELAIDGLIEGEANYVERQYTDRCGVDWECVETPRTDSAGTGGEPSIHLGVFVTVFQPYSDGPPYIEALRRAGGWDAVDAQYSSPPRSTEQVIHQDRRDEEPVPIQFEDTAQNGWSLFADQGMNGSDTAGEASMYAMFWYQNREYGASAVEWRSFLEPDGGDLDQYRYVSTPTTGWGNDRIYPYEKNGSFGYVWVTTWDTPKDATEFEAAYRSILRAHDAERVGERTWVIRDGPFADAFHVAIENQSVTIVNGPSVESLAAIRPGVSVVPHDAGDREAIDAIGDRVGVLEVALVVLVAWLAGLSLVVAGVVIVVAIVVVRRVNH